MNKPYTQEDKKMVVNEVVRRMLDNNESVRNILKDTSGRIKFPSSSTFYSWFKSNKELEDIYARGLKLQADILDDMVIEIAQNTDKDWYKDDKGNDKPNPVAVQRAGLIIKTFETVKAQRNHGKYGAKQDITSNGESIIPQINITGIDLNSLKNLKKQDND